MSQTESRHIINQLNKTKQVLERLLIQIESIDSHLKPLERKLQKREFTLRGKFEKRNRNLIICLPIGIGDEISIQETIEQSELKPTIIWVEDPTESEWSCQQITKLIDTEFVNGAMNPLIIVGFNSLCSIVS
jgi:hypothetical protein